MKKYTGAIILASISAIFGLISVIFGVDSVLATGEHATISEWIYTWWLNNPKMGDIVMTGIFGVIISALFALGMHFKYFQPKK